MLLEHLHNLNISHFYCHVQRSFTVALDGGEIRVVRKKQLHQALISLECSQVKRRAPVNGECIDIGSIGDEELCDLNVIVEKRPVQGRPPVIVLYVYLCFMGNEISHCLHVAVGNG